MVRWKMTQGPTRNTGSHGSAGVVTISDTGAQLGSLTFPSYFADHSNVQTTIRLNRVQISYRFLSKSLQNHVVPNRPDIMQNAPLSMPRRFLISHNHVKVGPQGYCKRTTSLLEHSAFSNTVNTLEIMPTRMISIKVDNSRARTGPYSLIVLHLI